MTQAEADAYMIQYFENSARESEHRAEMLERLYPYVDDRNQLEFMKRESRFLREQVKRMRKAAAEWARP